MGEVLEDTKTTDEGWVTKSLGFVWEKVVVGDSKFNPEKSCYQLATEYLDSGKTPEQCARDFINWQTGKAGVTGFALGLPGFTAMALTIPADFASVSYLQLRMIAVIGILFGWEATSDQLRTVAFSCLLGTAAGEAVRDVGVKASTRFGSRFVRNISGQSLKKVNDFFHIHNLFIKGVSAGTKAGGKAAAGAGKAGASAAGKAAATAGAKAGSKGIVNLSKMVPLLGGIVGGGLNIVFTRQMGLLAVKLLKGGPPDGRKSRPTDAVGHDGHHGPIVEGASEILEEFVADLPEDYTAHKAKPSDDDSSAAKADE